MVTASSYSYGSITPTPTPTPASASASARSNAAAAATAIASNPAVWGTSMWRFLHCAALSYPERGNAHSAIAMKNFVDALGDVLPCPTCAVNYRNHLHELPLDSFLGSRAELFEWTVQLHNMVSRNTNSKVISTQEAMQDLTRPSQNANANAVARVLYRVASDPTLLACVGLAVLCVTGWVTRLTLKTIVR